MGRFATSRLEMFRLCTLLVGGFGASAGAQGVTTAAIAGRIVDAKAGALAGVEVVVTNGATGIALRGVSRGDGRYLVRGLAVGGPYTVVARRLGSPLVRRSGIFLSLGQQFELDLTLESEPAVLQALETRAQPNRLFNRAHMGHAALLSDSLIRRMPVINRDVYDLVRLVPQMSTWFALAPAGAGARLNAIRIDGIGDQVPSSNLASGQLYGGKAIPLDAVKEYQVSLSPFDVRQGTFAGASVNVVTRSGTNELHGSLFAYGTNERLGANVPLIRNAPYRKGQFGLSLGGPIVRDRLLFFVSTELQRRVIPATGPSVADNGMSDGALPVSAAEIARFQRLLDARGLGGGSAGAVTNPNPSSSTFLRLDAPIGRWNSRLTIRGTYGHADSSIFARPTMLAPTNCPTIACFPLSSLQHSRWVDKRSGALELVTDFASGAYNELLAGYGGLTSGFRPVVRQPLILVNVPAIDGGPAELQSGTHEIATGQRNVSRTAEVTDNFSITAGSHRITVGASVQHFDLWAFQLRGSYGVWEFGSLDSFAVGEASHYRVARDTGSITAASGSNQAVYLSDAWDLSERLSLTAGIRGDVRLLAARPPYVAAVDSVFGLRTDRVPSGGIQWSPRIGFNYRLTSPQVRPAQLRGGIGLFTGPPPLFWLFGGFAAYGLATRTLQCGSRPGDVGAPPAFRSEYRNPPMACAGGETFGSSTRGEIDVIDPHLRPPRPLRGSLAVDGGLPLGITGTIEGLASRSTSGILFVPINLAVPTMRDSHGRQLYGTFGASGVAIPKRIDADLGDVIAVTDRSRDQSFDITGTLRRAGEAADVELSVSYGRSRDVASPRTVSALLTDSWRYERPVSGDENARTLGTSDYDQPIRVRASANWHSAWQRFPTSLSVFYIGGSGFPFTYVSGGAQALGDLNADGAVGNDPIYLPRSAFDTLEIRFGGTPTEVTAQQAAFERFVDGAPCLRRQRGRIMARNSCRTPWMNLMNAAIRQTLPVASDQAAALEVQVFNVLNLLNPRRGREEVPIGALATTSQFPLLSQVGETTGPRPQPVFRFDPAMSRYSSDNFDSYYQIQFAVRYSF